MSSNIDQLMLDMEKKARYEMKKIGDKFDHDSLEVQRLASTTMDIFSNTTLHQVSEISALSKKTCDDAYAAFQALVFMVDEQMRPLLSQNPSAGAVKKILDLIQKLNEESEIENNFTGNVNGIDLGSLVVKNYFPSVSAKAIESTWRTHYNFMSDKTNSEEKSAEDVAALKEKINADESHLQKEYEQKYACWKKEIETIEKRRSECYEIEVAKRKETLANTASEKKERAVKSEASKKESVEKEKENLLSKLEKRSFFSFFSKISINSRLKKIEEELEVIQQNLAKAEKCYSDEIDNIDDIFEKDKKAILKDIEVAHPLPPKPVNPVEINFSDCSKEANYIYNALEVGVEYTITQVVNLGVLGVSSASKAIAYLRELIVEDAVSNRKEKGISYYKREF